MKGDGMPTKVTLIYWPDPMFGMRWLCAVCFFWGTGGWAHKPASHRWTDSKSVRGINANKWKHKYFQRFCGLDRTAAEETFFLGQSRFGTTARGSMDHFRSPGSRPCPESGSLFRSHIPYPHSLPCCPATVSCRRAQLNI